MFSLLRINKMFKGLLFLLTLYISHSHANSAFDSFQTHGFINQGYFISSSNNLYGQSSTGNGSLGLTEIGLNASIRPFNQLSFAIQGIYRKAGALNNNARLDFALLDWTIYNTGDTQAGIRLGRVKNPIGFFNETRDMPFTRPSIFLPHGIYYERLRNLYLSSDGAQFYFNQSTDIGEFDIKVSIGQPLDDIKELEVAFFSFDAPGSLEPEDAYLAKLEYENRSGSTRLAISYVDIDLSYDPATHDLFDDGDITIKMLILSAQHRIDDFTLTGAYLRQKSSISNFGLFFPNSAPISESYYLQGQYQLTPTLQVGLRYDVSYINKDDKDGAFYSALTGKPRHSAFTKDSMLSLNWAPNKQWMLRTEYHRVNGTSLLSHADNPSPKTPTKNWDLFALQLSYRF